ncbi:unnamed protein product [Anisakis simplex]|uniref:C2H2-type domain-containing protein n=1 Tax=Anisakis simplex TaxID=6269 RepID=A0A0M3KIG3_ANISI|nr:unnamed protein product [Anisakis simplex]
MSFLLFCFAVVFSQHKDLLHHYKKEHVICEEGDCKQLGIAFRTETELKLHKSRDHAAGPQTLDVDIHFTDRSFGGGISRGGGGGASSSSHHRGGRGGGSGQGRGGTASAGHLPGSQRNVPRIGVVPSEQPKAPPREYGIEEPFGSLDTACLTFAGFEMIFRFFCGRWGGRIDCKNGFVVVIAVDEKNEE